MARKKNTRRPEPPPAGVLDWSDHKQHWAWDDPRPCRYGCGLLPTRLRDGSGKPAHKVCAEAAIAQQVQEYAEAYENERLRLT